MRFLILALLIGCGKDHVPYVCDSKEKEVLSSIMVDDNINELGGLLGDAKLTVQDFSPHYCSKTYVFASFNYSELKYCYYYAIDTECNGNIKEIRTKLKLDRKR